MARLEIRKGIDPGEQVIAISGTFVRDGDRVTPVPFRPFQSRAPVRAPSRIQQQSLSRSLITMALNVSAWSIRSPVPALVFFTVVMLLGIVSFQTLPITRFPNIDVPVVAVTVTQSGAAPAELEAQVTKEIEDAVANITGVKHVTSTITDGSSLTAIEFRLEVDTDRAVNDVKDAIAKIRMDLPRTIDEPIVERIDVEGQSIQSYAASAPGMTLEQLSWFVDDVVKRRLQGLKNVGRIDRIGGVSREIQVRLDPDRLMSLGITAADVNKQLRATNIDLGGGRSEFGGQEQAIRTLAGARTVESLRDTRIVLPGGREVRLSDLGEVTDAFEEPRSLRQAERQPAGRVLQRLSLQRRQQRRSRPAWSKRSWRSCRGPIRMSATP